MRVYRDAGFVDRKLIGFCREDTRIHRPGVNAALASWEIAEAHRRRNGHFFINVTVTQ